MQQHSNYSRVEREKRKKRQKRVLSFGIALSIVVIVVIYGVTSGYGNNLFDRVNEIGEQSPKDENKPEISSDKNNDDVDEDQNQHDEANERNEKEDQPDTETDVLPAEQPNERIKLTFVGDVLLGSTVDNLLTAHGYDYPYEHVLEHFQDSDLLAANLETPITERGEPENKQYVYRSKPDVLPAFKEAGFDVVTLANNHMLDYWHDGLIDTMQYLDEHEIARVGAGRDEKEAYAPVVLETDGIKVAYIGLSQVVPRNEWKATPYQPGVAETYSLERSVKAIQEAKELADLVVVLVHWGDERVEQADEQQMSTAHAYIDAGADLVVGSHPHVLQGFEQYNGKWIAYSLGNFIFTTNATHQQTWEGGILHAECTPEGDCELELVPVWNKWAKPAPMEEADRLRVFERFESESISIQDDGKVIMKNS